MDHTQDGGMEEVCSSCESGWTDYFLSPVNSTDDDMADHNDSGVSGEGHGGKDIIPSNKKGSDNDSLASDASSGPSHRKRPGKNGRASRRAGAEEGEDSGSDAQASTFNASGCSYKMGSGRVKKERSVDEKSNSHQQQLANTSARNEVRRKK